MGAQARYAPVIKFAVWFRQKMAHTKANQAYRYFTDEWKFYYGILQRQNGGEQIQVVGNDQIERRCRKKYRRLLVFLLTLIIPTLNLLERTSTQAIFAPVMEIVLYDFNEKWLMLKPKAYTSDGWQSIGADLQDQHGGK